LANSEWGVANGSIRYSPLTIRLLGVAAGITAAFEITGKVDNGQGCHPCTSS
jgi:hypothetical protein